MISLAVSIFLHLNYIAPLFDIANPSPLIRSLIPQNVN